MWVQCNLYKWGEHGMAKFELAPIIIFNWIKTRYDHIKQLHATLAKSLYDVSCANNNRFAVVVCFESALFATKCQKY